MKLHHTETQVHSSSNVEMSGFKIATSAKAFRILSSNLYKYKIRAVIRELSCNAVDGHIALAATGVEPSKQFDVTIPTPITNNFIVRDYGIGMSHDDIMNLYTTYFASTKSNSNDFVGALGLGSKSPFSYTDTFTITSWFGGVKRVYTAFIKDGEPNIAMNYEAESDEPTGIEINVPVFDDFDEWSKEAARVYSAFDEYQPNFLNKKIYYTKLIEGVNYNTHYAAGMYANMGGVIYPIPVEFYDKCIVALHAANSMYMLNFKLGELDITPSREELSLDDDTIAAIRARFVAVDKTDYEKIDKILAQDVDVREIYREILADFPAGTWNIISSRVVQGRSLREWYNRYQHSGITELTIVRYEGDKVSRKKCAKTRWSFSGAIDPTKITSQHSAPVDIIVDDLENTSSRNRIIMGAIELGLLKEKSTVGFVFKTQTDADAYRDSWHDAIKPKVVVLSEIKDAALKAMKSTAPRATYTVKRNPTVVIKYDDGVRTEIEMCAKDIRDGKLDAPWIEQTKDFIIVGEERLSPVVADTLLKLSKIKCYIIKPLLVKAATACSTKLSSDFIVTLLDNRVIDSYDVARSCPNWLYTMTNRETKKLNEIGLQIAEKCMISIHHDHSIMGAIRTLQYSKSDLIRNAYDEYKKRLDLVLVSTNTVYNDVHTQNALVIHAIQTRYMCSPVQEAEIADMFVIPQ
ncbi:MAG: hypothetical protein ACRC3J_01805 [Culicoidibacterales bacterium]